ncbi:MAG: AI-2E family transporter [Paracoccaceae bacterium]
MPNGRFQTLMPAFAFLGLFVLVTWVMYLGQTILIPLAFAVVAAFVLWRVVEWLGTVRFIGRTPLWLRHMVVLVIFIVGLVVMAIQIRVNIEVLVERLPIYQTNIIQFLDGMLIRFGLDEQWADGIAELMFGQFNTQAIARSALAALGSLGGLILLVILYTVFLLIEYTGFVKKLHLAVRDSAGVDRILTISRHVNERIGGFLAVKTLVNIILALVSYVAMLLLGIELAGFWAIVIGVLNYIPYLGSIIAVAFPVLTTLAQSGSLRETVVALVVLTLIQVIVSWAVEPPLIGRRLNLSPLVVLLSLASWYALWGLSGAVLAIPMTVIILSILGAIDATRPIAILLSNDGRA